MKLDRPTQRKPDGNITAMMKDENWFELVQGDHSPSGGQWDIWEATFGPRGPPMQEPMGKMTTAMERSAPAGADLKSWRY
jgi:hypothetical protein